MPTETVVHVPFECGITWVKVTHPDVARIGAYPLIVLHGGPGFCHNYVGNLAELADRTGRVVVLYDQYGCGNSTKRPDAPIEFWTPDLFVREFFNLLDALKVRFPGEFDTYHLLGQSWGGMLGSEIAVTRPIGLASLSLCNTLASMERWITAANTLLAELPSDVQDTLARHESAGTYDDPEYVWATKVYDTLHVHRTAVEPTEYVDSEAAISIDPTVYNTMNGPNEFHVVGTLKDWTVEDRIPLIQAPTLVLAGEFDEATPLCWQPFVDKIRDVQSVIMKGCSHCSHLENPEEFFRIVGHFMAAHDDPTACASR
jgi:L-proline amide hydrolase